ncbi:MAG: hypothetical protein FWG40_00650 [Peptococcaceae bacterium]|nr:hypothetical protein [Peptococcaceae bacterium]
MYKVLVSFTDTSDGYHVYWVGQSYPREGYEPSRKRLEYLLGNKNKFKMPVIEQEDTDEC